MKAQYDSLLSAVRPWSPLTSRGANRERRGSGYDLREVVRLAGFGAFAAKGRPARKGRHPRTGASIAVPASKAVRFRVPESPEP